MSFSGTPLGQGRRLDHNTFLGKQPSNGNNPPSPHHPIPTSYAYGAPTLGSRSPPKPSSPIRERTNTNIDIENDPNEPALTRYARLKQREQASLASRPGGPKTITSPPRPEKWSVKDTSVNIATAFHQAVNDMHPASNPNNSWASGSRSNTNVPRSTSVEYEKETQSTITRRLAAPPNRLTRKPLSKTTSVRHVPDSEGEEERVDQTGRGKSPFEAVVDMTKRALAPATFYLRQRSQEPGDQPNTQPSTNGRDHSYDYSAEEREFQAAQSQSNSRRTNNTAHRRGRMSTDNKAYKPSASDLDVSDEEISDDGKRRRRKKKKEPVGGPLTTLPVFGPDKRKKKRVRGSRGNAEEAEYEESDEEHFSDRQSAQQRASASRGSAPPLAVPRGSVPPETQRDPDESFDAEQALDSIPEVDEQQLDDPEYQHRHQADPPSRPFSIGGFLGNIVHRLYLIALYGLQFISMILFVLGKVIGMTFDIIFNRPIRWIASTNTGPVVTLGRYLILGFILSAAWYTLQDPLIHYIPRFTSSPSYHAPEVPAANIAELSARLQRIETALSGLSLDSERSRVKAENEARSHVELVGRIGALESRIQKESARALEAEEQFGKSASQGLRAVKQEVEILHAQIQAQAQQGAERSEGSGSDEEARATLKALEERVGNVEGGVKEALELGKKSGGGAGSGAAWWNKLASGSASKSGLSIKSSDGQDITSLIGHLVDSAVSTYGKDNIARPDFALHSGGARIIPSLTSPTFEMRPANLRGQVVGRLTGNGYAIGRPPITALHHESHNGHCWPFAGSEGQLGVSLASPTYISEVSIDHVAKEVAFDMRSAPREMELWGLVEGRDNISKVKEFKAEKARRKEERKREAEEKGEKVPTDEVEELYPRTLPMSPQYIRIASFRYDIHAPNNVQTFPVSQEIRDLEVDFGIVVLRVRSNWGRDEFTCLYRLRVHGQRMGETPLPYPEDQ